MSQPPRKGRGRPLKAAQTLDEAVQAVYAGTAPARPRNMHERWAGEKTRGRKPNSFSPTRIAAEWAEYLVNSDGMPLAQAARMAASAYGINADNVRKYARRLLVGPQVTISAPVAPMYRQLIGGAATVEEIRPLLHSVTDAAKDNAS